ncbi:phosphotransferase family protein [Pseudonocardia acidicola]|uniref:Phosphotransferase family protein n=1 Tax=Pseudonocardia acidicola TaxID=2724939 RepID=A0ABX1SJZ5_9PSEU|nr:phosphotransferase family protein [Pseudonocardia acidicola]NMI00834.1 phosphotransferase family protein [Pseudonocardia acidicola]
MTQSRSTEIDDPVPADALSGWLAAEVPEVAVGSGPVTVHRISGGHSNLTYRIVDAAGVGWALRRPPTGGVLATAHDMSREWRFIAALAPTPVPVPRPVAYCADAGVIGAEFYVMGFVEGTVLGDEAAGEELAVEHRHAAGLAVVDVLADLHAVDPDAVGLGELRRPGSYLERQLRRWHRQVHASAVPDLSVVDAVHERLVERMPATLPYSQVRIAHGDFRPGNLSFSADGSIGAVFDWELATLGDPLADLGWVLASWARPGDTEAPTTPGPTALDGFPERDELIARYAARSGRDLADLPYYLAFARWRSACIGAGVYTRYAAGVMGSDAADMGDVAVARLESVQAQARAALAALGG